MPCVHLPTPYVRSILRINLPNHSTYPTQCCTFGVAFEKPLIFLGYYVLSTKYIGTEKWQPNT